MPTVNYGWKILKKLFTPLTPIENLERSLAKNLPLSTIITLVKILYINKESIPLSLLQAHTKTLLPILESIINETPFDKKIMVGYPINSELLEVTLNPGEVHCCLCGHSTQGLFQTTYPWLWWIFYRACDAVGQEHSGTVNLQIQNYPEQSVYALESDRNQSLLHQHLDNALVLTNAPVIRQAHHDLEKYYLSVAHHCLIQSQLTTNSDVDKHQLQENALKACLHLSSTENEEDFNTRFKTTIAEIYFSDSTEMKPITPLVFAYLKKSHLHPEETHEVLKIEKFRHSH